MNHQLFLLWYLLVSLIFPNVVGAADESKQTASGEQADAALAELSVSKQSAVVKLIIETGANRGQRFSGAFISADGQALVPLAGFVGNEKVGVATAEGSRLKLGEILAIFPEQELLLMKFEHRPKDWLKVAPEEPSMGESVAFVFEPAAEGDRPDRIPPLMGPVMARRSEIVSGNIKSGGFRTVLSLGAGLSERQRMALSPGICAIDSSGDLVGVSGGVVPAGDGSGSTDHSLIFLTVVCGLADEIIESVGGGERIPRSEVDQHVNTALIDNDSRRFDQAMFRRDFVQASALMRGMLSRNPDNFVLKEQALKFGLCDASGKPLVSLEDFVVNPHFSKSHQIAVLQYRGVILAGLGKTKDAIKEWEHAVSLGPADYSGSRLLLARLYKQMARRGEAVSLDEAVSLFEECLPYHSDSIPYIDELKDLYYGQGKYDAVKKMMAKRAELKKNYGL